MESVAAVSEGHPEYETKSLPTINTLDLDEGVTQYRENRFSSVTSTTGASGRRASTTEDAYWKLSTAVSDLSQLTADAKAATHAEHKMTVLEGLRLYPKAVGWSVLLSLAIVMEGYDTILLSQFFALPEFRKHFGRPTKHGGYEVSAPWQSGLTNGAQVGEILGLFLNGIIAEKYGYRICMMSSLVGITCFVFLAFFAVNKEMLLVAEILCGIPWGVFQTLTTTYAAEVMPVALRAYLTTYINLCWITGQLIGSSVLRGFVNNSTQWSYRIPFALQWFWALPLLIGVWFAPESPWWLVRHGRLEDAKKSLLRLTSTHSSTDFNVYQTIAMMRHTDELEKSMSKGHSYLDCFKGSELRRTEIACMVWAIQIFCGSPIFIYSTYFFVQTGLPNIEAFDLSIGQYALGFLATVSAWGLVRLCGRRTLYLWGIGVMFILLLAIGALGTQPLTGAVSWAMAALVLVFTFIYDLTVGPVCYSLVPEIPSTRLRIKTVVLARVTYNVAFLVANIIMPKMLNSTALNWKGKTAFFWAVFCLLSFVWAYLRLPEPKGLTYCELDILFEHKANARKFRRFQVILETSGYFSVESSDDARRASSADFGA